MNSSRCPAHSSWKKAIPKYYIILWVSERHNCYWNIYCDENVFYYSVIKQIFGKKFHIGLYELFFLVKCEKPNEVDDVFRYVIVIKFHIPVWKIIKNIKSSFKIINIWFWSFKNSLTFSIKTSLTYPKQHCCLLHSGSIYDCTHYYIAILSSARTLQRNCYLWCDGPHRDL